MTPAEFAVLVDSRLKHHRSLIDVMDVMNALNCQITLGNPDVKLADLRLFAPEEVIEQTTEAAVNVFKQWVSVTGGETK